MPTASAASGTRARAAASKRLARRAPAQPRPGIDLLREWLASRGWKPFPFQEEAWAAQQRGECGLINVPTGAGKTYAAYLGPLGEVVDEATSRPGPVEGLRILFITPLRAVSRDIQLALKDPVEELGLARRIKVESRTGDTSSSVRARQKKQLPPVLITTPESLSLLLSLDNSAALFAGLRTIIADEWHELLSSKRGTQTELALARLRRLSPGLRTWALSATLANLNEAASAVVGSEREPCIIRAEIKRPITIETLIPKDPHRLPWAGHLGLRMLPELLEALNPGRSTLIFTNTRSQAEIWYQAIRFSKPEWSEVLALHHGSIDRAERERVERGLKSGAIRLVVCTSSLDLGVDFAPVEVVVQVGSPKGVARLMQRAGRAGHRPGAPCRIICIPTHAMELVEVASVRHAIASGEIESRNSLSKPLDVLAQHLVTCALGGGFNADELFDEVRTAFTYRHLSRQEFDWSLALVREGGGTLRAYPEFHKVVQDPTGRYTVENKRIAQLHRLNIGTITGDATLTLRYTSGRTLGSIEESFVAHLHPGQKFFFAGKTLEFIRIVDLEAFVRPARGKCSYTSRWSGTKLPISESLSEEIRRTLAAVGENANSDEGNGKAPIKALAAEPELRAALPMLRVQAHLSRIPSAGGILAELLETREGHHLFLFPFEGRLVHGGLAALLALRITRLQPSTLSLSANDYGLELLSPDPLEFDQLLTPDLLSDTNLAEDAIASVNISALARAQFREIARVSGLVFQTYPGARKSGRQLQASSSLLFDVFNEFDPGNLLLEQARREVLERHFEESRLARTLRRLRESTLIVTRPPRPTPLAFPLMLERFGERMSSQTIIERLERMRREWETGIDEPELKSPRTRSRSPSRKRKSLRR